MLVVLCCLLVVPAVSASDEPPGIDDYAYDQAKECRKRPTPGALALVEWLERNAGSWWSGSERMEPYSACFTEKGKPRKRVDRTTAHRDHIHFGLSWAGARKRTSFWLPARG